MMRYVWLLALVCGGILAGEAKGTVQAPSSGAAGEVVILPSTTPDPDAIQTYFMGLAEYAVGGVFYEKPTAYRFRDGDKDSEIGRLYLKDGVVKFDGDAKRVAALISKVLPLIEKEDPVLQRKPGSIEDFGKHCRIIFTDLNRASVTKTKAGLVYTGNWDKKASAVFDLAYGATKP